MSGNSLQLRQLLRNFRQYLLGQRFTILTNHRSLKELLTQVIQSPEQHLYLARLMGFDYQIKYRLGANNQVADALSHLPEQKVPICMVLSVPCLSFLTKIHHQLSTNQEYLQLRLSLIHI